MQRIEIHETHRNQRHIQTLAQISVCSSNRLSEFCLNINESPSSAFRTQTGANYEGSGQNNKHYDNKSVPGASGCNIKAQFQQSASTDSGAGEKVNPNINVVGETVDNRNV